MREITMQEVHVGCMACDAERTARNKGTAFVAGILTALLKDDFALCSPHYAGFKNAERKITDADATWKRTAAATELPGGDT